MPVHPPVSPTRMETIIPSIAPGDTAYVEFYNDFLLRYDLQCRLYPASLGLFKHLQRGPARPLPILEPLKQDKTKRTRPIHFRWMHRCKSMTDKRLPWKCCQTATVFPRFTIQLRRIWNTNTRFRPVLCFRATRPIFPLLMPEVPPDPPIISTTREGVLTVRFNAPISFSQTRSRTLLKLKAQCGTSGNKTLSFQSQFVSDPSCSTGCGALPPQCSTIVTELLCPGGTCAQGMELGHVRYTAHYARQSRQQQRQ